ncbi:hypothetical protein [Polaromonas jejuensis]|uniref:Uncharacterized protein n=1 Tax=Polaromonas jejuensis TaxID=457502 RepID=A0ABW0QF06_9BURK|nr:hypothetical protein [Polaromonas jejuensis]
MIGLQRCGYRQSTTDALNKGGWRCCADVPGLNANFLNVCNAALNRSLTLAISPVGFGQERNLNDDRFEGAIQRFIG